MKIMIKTMILALTLTATQTVLSAEQKFCDLDVSGSTTKIYKKFSGHSFGSYPQALGNAVSKCHSEGFTSCRELSVESWDPIWSIFVQVEGSKEAPNQSETLRINKCNKIDSCYEKMILTQTNDSQLKSGLQELSARYQCHTGSTPASPEESTASSEGQTTNAIDLGSSH